MLSLDRTAFACALVLVSAGCTRKTIYPIHDGGQDVGSPHDAGRDAGSPHEAGADADPPRDAGRDVVVSPDDGGRDVVVSPRDAGRDVAPSRDAGPADAAHDAAPRDAGIVCAQPVGASQCATSDAASACRRTWAEVLTTTPDCRPSIYESRGTCGAYDELEVVDGSQKGMYYYDKSTGQLVAVYTMSGTTPSCYEGPPEGIPTCDLPAADNLCLRDAATDGRD